MLSNRVAQGAASECVSVQDALCRRRTGCAESLQGASQGSLETVSEFRRGNRGGRKACTGDVKQKCCSLRTLLYYSAPQNFKMSYQQKDTTGLTLMTASAYHRPGSF